MILHIVIIFLMKLQCDYALGNATFAGKLRLIAASGSNVNLPCTFSRNQSDMVTLVLFYRNASHVGQVGAPLYTLDARMMNDHKLADQRPPADHRDHQKYAVLHRFNEDVLVGDRKLSGAPKNEPAYGHHKLMRQSGDKEYFLDDQLDSQSNRASPINYRHRLLKRSPASPLITRQGARNQNSSKHERTNSNENHRLTSSIGNVSMVNGISSLMQLLAIKGHLNQSRLAAMIGEEQTISQEQQISAPDNASNQTKLINVEKKSAANGQALKSLFYQLQHDRQSDRQPDRQAERESWQQTESNLPERRNQVNNLFGRTGATGGEPLIGGDASLARAPIEFNGGNLVRSPAVDQLEDQPQHFVAPQLANRIRLNWPPARLRQYQPYNNPQNLDSGASSNSTYGSRKLESRSQTNHVKSDPLLHFNALLSIKNATEEDAGEYLCRVDLRYGRTMIQHIVLEIVSPPERVLILDSNSQVLSDWTNAYLENAKTIFNCEVDGGRPQTPIEWLLNGELLNPTWSNSIKLQNTGVTRSQLHLQMTRELFNGTLSCRVQNQFYTMSAAVRIDLTLKPQRITLRPTVTPLIVDNQVDLIAQTHGSYPPADLVCFLRNQTLTGEIKKASHLKLYSTTTLIVKYVPSRLDHNEKIVCKAINHAFPVNESIELRNKLDIHYKPILKLRLQNGNPNRLIEGCSFALFCEIDSNPMYKQIQWFKNDLLYTPLNNHIQSELRIDNTSLVTNSLSKLDSGRYACSARNAVGTSDSESVTIDVLHAPECRPSQKFIYGIEHGETTIIDCNLISNPSDRLTFHWRYHDANGETIDLATISTQIGDDAYRRSLSSTNTPSYSALKQSDPSAGRNRTVADLLSSSISADDLTGNLNPNSIAKPNGNLNGNPKSANGHANNEPVPSRYLSSSFDTNIYSTDRFPPSSFLNGPPLPPANNERSNLLQQIFISSNGTSSSLHYTMKHNKKEIGSFIECWASNTIGVQKEPCMYSLVVLDVPEAPKNCTISAPINNFHLLECSPGANGNLPPQLFHLEVYAYLDRRKPALTNEQTTASGEQPSSILLNENHREPADEFGRTNGEWKADGEASKAAGELKQPNGHKSRPFVKIKSGEHSSNSQEANLDTNHEPNQEINYDKNRASGNHKINFHSVPDEKHPDYNQYDDYPAVRPTGQLMLIANYTEYSYPTFVLSLINMVNMNLTGLDLQKLAGIDTLHLMIYSSNHKGRSSKISLDFSIGNQTSQLKHLFAQQKNGHGGSKFNLLSEWSLIFTAVLSTMIVWFFCTVIYLVVANRIKQIKAARRYIQECNKNAAIKVSQQQQNSLVPVSHQGLPAPYIATGNEIDLHPGNVIAPEPFNATNVYGCSSMIVNHFEPKNFQTSPNALSSAELLKLKIKQLD